MDGAPAGAATATGSVVAVCRVHQLLPDDGTVGTTAIDKRPVAGRVRVRTLGLYADVQADRKDHGGVDKALYAYAEESAQSWAAELGYPVTPGLFGENLRLAGVAVDDAEIGETWRLGSGEDAAEVEVTMPRTPCATFARRLGEDRWVRRFGARGLVGAYLRVVRPGWVAAGDPVTVLSRPGHGVTVRGWWTRASPEDAATLLALDAEGALALAEDMASVLRAVAERSARSSEQVAGPV